MPGKVTACYLEAGSYRPERYQADFAKTFSGVALVDDRMPMRHQFTSWAAALESGRRSVSRHDNIKVYLLQRRERYRRR